MPRLLTRIALTGVLAGLLAGPGRASGPAERRSSGAWWAAQYGELGASGAPRDLALARRAEAVFGRVVRAADVRATRFPRLVLLDRHPAPRAQALPDGSVVLSRGALERCFAEGPRGDSVLSFVFAHELSHLSRDDFAHFDSGGAAGELLHAKADADAVVIVTRAGYDARALTGPRGRAFLLSWDAADSPGAVRDAGARARRIEAGIQAIVDELPVFRAAVRLLQAGRIDAARAFYLRFSQRIASTEVLGGLAVCEVRDAFAAVHRCNPALPPRFLLPLRVDARSVAETMRSLPGIDAGCWTRPAVRARLSEAQRLLVEAIRQRPSSVTARLSLGTVHVLLGDGTKAVSEADEVLALEPGCGEARSLRAVALPASGTATPAEVAASLEALRTLRREQPQLPDAAFNLARLLDETGHAAEARTELAAFLAVEPGGAFARTARAALGVDDPARLVPLPLQAPEASAFRAARRLRFFAGGEAEVALTDRFLEVRVDGQRELVEHRLARPIPAASLAGRPLERIPNGRGSTLVFDRFAADVEDGRITALVTFD